MKIKIDTYMYANYRDIAEARQCAAMPDPLSPYAGGTAEQAIERADRYDPRVRGAALDGLYATLSPREQARYRGIGQAGVDNLI